MDRTGLQGYSYQSYPIVTTGPPAADMTATSIFTLHQGTSSAFSPSAHPNEDWTKISDLAERRRIQNRIAQRNYRKRLKRRLEDLERRAASTSTSPEPSQAETTQESKSATKRPQAPKANSTTTRKKRLSAAESKNKSWNLSHSPFPLQQSQTYGTMSEERGVSSSVYTDQLNSPQIPASSPPDSFFYPPYPSYQEVYDHNSSYQSPQPLHAFPTIPQSHYGEFAGQGTSQQPLGHLSQHPLASNLQPVKQMNAFSEEQDLNPLYVNYVSLSGLEAPLHQPQYNQQSQTPPLTNTYPDRYSTSTSSIGSLSEHFPLTLEHAISSPSHITIH
ncbi:conserved hypothetical protein [Talaromyces stipitatus ATCC 10500]|uniref:BZIP domain-containing protein n=1 Tax=Talaromyces stipitatus (strain ATCC 10500 / CBS 375.48 / QM 6759 / NRRL 1006) TaxID=441959 RepID=B8LUF9_TALSN|nr:uncharacterized protein TSTA_071310 [Talaromyces stipitatus ATCC 10500]EED23732.1 conserved hypothetical protein [Talaromyces stipitatus ATCC 10500]